MMVGGGVFGVTEPGCDVVLDEVVSVGAGGGVFGHGELSFPGPRYKNATVLNTVRSVEIWRLMWLRRSGG